MAGILLSRPGKRYRFRELEFWAERGQIHCLDYRNDAYNPEYKVVPVREMLLRARSLSQAVKRIKYPSERNEHITLIEQLVAACREAKRQGRPDDPKTFEHIRAMRSKHILMPGPDITVRNVKE